MARPLDSGAKKYRHKGRSLTIREWAEALDIPRQTIITRLRRGCTTAQALAPRSTPRTLTVGGQTMTVAEWAEENDVPANTIKWRLLKGGKPSEAVDPDYERRS